ncbi:hypothetical protein BDW02DRAFT_81155 [Decorospora gaudefroyi]|uniref:Uncharacterized protein n=1 Tax=Decorospora gaudefroyi TaxID=184978 RepID=A0A6A5K8S2_9PLEO|nr:hypothetical protein BDW02DRAFT_81155 [Decorospora gaudefroyi]
MYVLQPVPSCLCTNHHRPRCLSKQQRPTAITSSQPGLGCGASTLARRSCPQDACRRSRPLTRASRTSCESLIGLTKVATYLRKVDEPTYNRMRCSHRDISEFSLSNVDQHRAAEAHKAWFAKDPDRASTSSYHLAGIGSMMAVSISTGVGTGYHYDEGDGGMSSH